MSKKQDFINMVEELLEFPGTGLIPTEDALAYFDAFKNDNKAEKPQFTDNGKLILKYMQEDQEKTQNMFKAREIGEGIFIPSRSVSGSIRKLVTDGFVEKIGVDPVIYALTDLGKTIEIN